MLPIAQPKEKHPLSAGMDQPFDSEQQGPMKQLRRPGDNSLHMQAAANASPQVRQLKAAEAAANTAVAQRKNSNETGLPDHLKAGIESLSGISLDHVRVHYNSSKPAEVNALAYAEGHVIHVAPGQEQHLPEEAWHIVQQSQGRVMATTKINGADINADPALEREAALMGAKALRTAPGTPQSPPKTAAAPAQQVKQLKSHFTENTADKDVKTPIHALSEQIKPYFEKANLPEAYYFHDQKLLYPNTYNRKYQRAKSVKAVIEKKSTKGGERDGALIRDYGHFGVMERSIMGRPDRGNLFDGGHLIEHSLMEDSDADIHGNLAPQENKEFNQNLMRGWEHIPEHYQQEMNFTYRMKLAYAADTYTRTGADLLEAGIIHVGLLKKLDKINDEQHGTLAEAFKQQIFTFDSWVPYEWKGKIDAGDKHFGSYNFRKGSHFEKLQPSREEARNRVVSQDPGNGLNGNILTNAGIVSGHITDTYGSSFLDEERIHFGGSKVIKSYLYSGVPQPLTVQPINDRNGESPVSMLPQMSRRTRVLRDEVFLDRLKADIQKMSFHKIVKGRQKTLANSTIYGRIKDIPEIKTFRGKRVAEKELVNMSKKIRRLSEDESLTAVTFQKICKSSFDRKSMAFASNVLYDDKFHETGGVPPKQSPDMDEDHDDD